MDEALTPARAAKSASLFLLAVMAAMAALQAQAQALQDPTRPPAAAMTAVASPAAAAAASGPRLQTILVGREAGGRHLAIIDGETVRLGEEFHGARVVRIGDNEVELVRGKERQVLRLYAQEASGVTPVQARAKAQARR